MRLTNYTNYTLRTLQMAAVQAPRLVRIDEVARAHRINRAHLTKVVHQLARDGFLETVRGPKGGLRLAKPAHDIAVGAVVRLAEGPLVLVECFNPVRNTCQLRGICRLSAKLMQATGAFMAVLDDLTFADITLNRTDLMPRLGLEEAPS